MSLEKFEKKIELVFDLLTPECIPFAKQGGKQKKEIVKKVFSCPTS